MNKFLVILLYISVNIVVLFSISPVIDHFFTDLDENDPTYQILAEIIGQILIVSLIWYFMDKYILTKIKESLGIHKNELVEKVRDIVIAVVFVGLQKHLIHKLEYISSKHPLSRLFLTK
jgi:hypothetical protein